MPPTTLYVKPDEALHARVRQAATADGLSIGEFLRRLIASHFEGPAAAASATPSRHAAAMALLKHLDPAHAELILDCCADSGRRPFDYLITYAHLAYERGEAATIWHDSAAPDDEEALDAAPLAVETSVGTQAVCAYDACHRSFTLTRRGQKFCPPPDDDTESCGRKAHLAALHAARPPRRDNQYAPPTGAITAAQIAAAVSVP